MRILVLVAVALLVLLVGWLLVDAATQPAEPEGIAAVTVIRPGFPTYVGQPPPETTTTTVAARARTAPLIHAQTAGAPVSEATWLAIAQCESGQRWNDTRGGYEGGLHFAHDTWVRAGGRRFAEHAYQATRGQQIEIANEWLARTSWAQWPVCSRKVGVR